MADGKQTCSRRTSAASNFVRVRVQRKFEPCSQGYGFSSNVPKKRFCGNVLEQRNVMERTKNVSVRTKNNLPRTTRTAFREPRTTMSANQEQRTTFREPRTTNCKNNVPQSVNTHENVRKRLPHLSVSASVNVLCTRFCVICATSLQLLHPSLQLSASRECIVSASTYHNVSQPRNLTTSCNLVTTQPRNLATSTTSQPRNLATSQPQRQLQLQLQLTATVEGQPANSLSVREAVRDNKLCISPRPVPCRSNILAILEMLCTDLKCLQRLERLLSNVLAVPETSWLSSATFWLTSKRQGCPSNVLRSSRRFWLVLRLLRPPSFCCQSVWLRPPSSAVLRLQCVPWSLLQSNRQFL